MPETKEPVGPEKKGEPKKVEQKTVPLSKFIGLQNKMKRTGEQLEQSKREIGNLKTELKVVRVDADDEGEISAVKKLLLEQSEQLTKDRAKLEEDVASHEKERERGARAKELVAEYEQRGVELDVDALLAEDDMDKFAATKHVEFLAEENKKLKEGTPESIYESTPGGIVKKQPKDMDEKELAEFEKKLKAEYYEKQK